MYYTDGITQVLTQFSASDMNQFIFEFNYESPDCSNTNGPTDQSVTGCSLKANLLTSDFALLELNQLPPPTYNVYYAGWSNSPTAATSATGIHHPNGDIKKICVENEVLTSAIVFGNVNTWQVNDWDVGITAAGSSGSPLFDSNKRIVGQLCSGLSFCTDNNTGNTDNGEPDFYGKFSHSWDVGTSAAERLEDWLDPNDTGITTLDGINANAKTWTGATDTNWADPSNWNPVGIPSTLSEVTIPDTANEPIIGAGTAAVAKNVKIQEDAETNSFSNSQPYYQWVKRRCPSQSRKGRQFGYHYHWKYSGNCR